MNALAFLGGLSRKFSEARERNRVTRALDAMSDEALRDIGFTRAEIDRIATDGIRRRSR